MVKNNNNLQDIFLNNARIHKISLKVLLNNGTVINGYVKGFDNFTVVLDSDGTELLIYKHGISTITPEKPILFTEKNINK